MKNGGWVCLMNCHLSESWMPRLEKIVEDALMGVTTGIHDNFRMWLTSMPSPKFPVAVLQNGIKLTTEPPRGIRANVLNSLMELGSEGWDQCPKERLWKKLIVGLAFFHATVQERRKFGSLGWNIPYEWNNSDLTISIKLLKMYLEEQEEVPYDTLRYITGEVNYGGRVTDHWDQRTMNSIISRLICSEMLDDTYRFDNQGKYYVSKEQHVH